MNWSEMLAEAASLKERGLEPFLLSGRQGMMAVHHETLCYPPCPVHAPSDHRLNEAPLIWRADRRMFERMCSHGTGHPDPDDLAFKEKTMSEQMYKSRAFGIHGCCAERCCHV